MVDGVMKEMAELAQREVDFFKKRRDEHLRDLFAASALSSGLISSYSRLDEANGHRAMARDAYAIADAMMEARKG